LHNYANKANTAKNIALNK